MIIQWLVSNFEKQRNQIEKEAAVSGLASHVEGIHRLRVAIKQVRALFKLVAWLAPKSFDSKAAFSELRSLFKAMGRVRDIQVLEGLMAMYGERNGEWYAGLGFLLDQRRRGAQADMPTAISAFAPSNLVGVQGQMETALEQLSDEQLLEKAHRKLKKRLAKVRAALPEAFERPEILHDVRTWLKECLYVMEMLNKAVDWEVWPKKMVKDLFWVAREAGEWHDREIFLSLLDNLGSEEAPFLKAPAYAELKEGLGKEVRDRASQLIKRIQDFLVSFDNVPIPLSPTNGGPEPSET